MKKAGFSLLEVLFSVAFLILVGLAVIALNVASLRLITSSETKTTAYALNDEAISYLAVLFHTKSIAEFETLVLGEKDCDGPSGCYLRCSVTQLNQECSLEQMPDTVQLGRSRLSFVRQLRVSETPAGSDKYLVHTSVSWGSGINREIQASYFLEK